MTATAQPTRLLIPLPYAIKAQQMDGRRFVYFETSREGVIDRENEDIAANALWKSRSLFLSQGNLDLNHWSWLGNPYGTGAAPQYVIGQPDDVKRDGPSIFVKGEIYSSLTPPPEDSSGDWADKFWHGQTEMNPPQRWFPSVFGQIQPGGVEIVKRGNALIRYITALEWFSVGFAQRAQHGGLDAVGLSPLGPFAKASDFGSFSSPILERDRPLVMDYATFAKAMSSGVAVTSTVTDSALKTGPSALQRESLDQGGYKKKARKVFKRILRKDFKPDREGIAKAFFEEGASVLEAAAMSERFLTEAALMGR